MIYGDVLNPRPESPPRKIRQRNVSPRPEPPPEPRKARQRKVRRASPTINSRGTGLGMGKHRTMGTPGPNRRMLQGLARTVNTLFYDRPKRAAGTMYGSIRDLMKREGRSR